MIFAYFHADTGKTKEFNAADGSLLLLKMIFPYFHADTGKTKELSAAEGSLLLLKMIIPYFHADTGKTKKLNAAEGSLLTSQLLSHVRNSTSVTEPPRLVYSVLQCSHRSPLDVILRQSSPYIPTLLL
jgi:hypothetical protein